MAWTDLLTAIKKDTLAAPPRITPPSPDHVAALNDAASWVNSGSIAAARPPTVAPPLGGLTSAAAQAYADYDAAQLRKMAQVGEYAPRLAQDWAGSRTIEQARPPVLTDAAARAYEAYDTARASHPLTGAPFIPTNGPQETPIQGQPFSNVPAPTYTGQGATREQQAAALARPEAQGALQGAIGAAIGVGQRGLASDLQQRRKDAALLDEQGRAVNLPPRPDLVPEPGAQLDAQQQDQVHRFGRLLTPTEEVELHYRVPQHQELIGALSNPIGYGAQKLDEGIKGIPTGGGTTLGQRIDNIDNPVVRNAVSIGVTLAPYIIAGLVTGGAADLGLVGGGIGRSQASRFFAASAAKAATRATAGDVAAGLTGGMVAPGLGQAFEGQAAMGVGETIGQSEENDLTALAGNVGVLLGAKLFYLGVGNSAAAVEWLKSAGGKSWLGETIPAEATALRLAGGPDVPKSTGARVERVLSSADRLKPDSGLTGPERRVTLDLAQRQLDLLNQDAAFTSKLGGGKLVFDRQMGFHNDILGAELMISREGILTPVTNRVRQALESFGKQGGLASERGSVGKGDIVERPQTPMDTQTDRHTLETAAGDRIEYRGTHVNDVTVIAQGQGTGSALLTATLSRIAASHPGVPITADLNSEGGARLFARQPGVQFEDRQGNALTPDAAAAAASRGEGPTATITAPTAAPATPAPRTPGENPVTSEDIMGRNVSATPHENFLAQSTAQLPTSTLAKNLNTYEGAVQQLTSMTQASDTGGSADTKASLARATTQLSAVVNELQKRSEAGDAAAKKAYETHLRPISETNNTLRTADLTARIDDASTFFPGQYKDPAKQAQLQGIVSEIQRRALDTTPVPNDGTAKSQRILADRSEAKAYLKQQPSLTNQRANENPPMRVGAVGPSGERPSFLPEKMTDKQARALLGTGLLSAGETKAIKGWLSGPGVSGAQRYPAEGQQPPRLPARAVASAAAQPAYQPPQRPEKQAPVDKLVAHQLQHVEGLSEEQAKAMAPGVTAAIHAVADGNPGKRIKSIEGPTGKPMTAKQIVAQHRVQELVDYERTRRPGTTPRPIRAKAAPVPREKVTVLGIEGEKGKRLLQPAHDSAKDYLATLKPNPKGAKGFQTLPGPNNALPGRAIVTAKDLEKTRVHAEAMVQKGIAGRYWYEQGGREILDAFSGDVQMAKKYAGTLALLSNKATVAANTATALRIIEQHAAGLPLTGAGSADQVAKLKAFLDNPTNAGALKTNAFYMAHLRIIDHAEWLKLNQNLPTADIWIGRTYGYDVGTKTINGKQVDRSISPAQYHFPAADILRIEQKLQQEDPSWTYDQVQAAMWTGQKALDQGTSTEAAAVHYGDTLKKHMAQVSTESAPGATWLRKDGGRQLEGFEGAPAHVQDAYHAAKAAVIAPNGVDLIAQQLQLPQAGASTEPGIFGSQAHPSTQQRVFTSTGMGGVVSGRVGPEARVLLDALAASHGYINHQDAMAWSRLFPVKELYRQNAMSVNIGRSLTASEGTQLALALQAEGHEVAIVGTPAGAHVLDLTRQPLAQLSPKDVQAAMTPRARAFQSVVNRAVGEVIPEDAKTMPMGYDSGYLENDWGTGGQGYTSAIRRTGLPEGARRRLLDLVGQLSRESKAVDARFAKEQGWKYDAPKVETPFRPAERYPSEFAPAPPAVKSVPFVLKPGGETPPEKPAFSFNPSQEELAHLTNLIEHGDWTTTPGARINAKATLNRLLKGNAPTDKEFDLLQRVFSSTGKMPGTPALTPSQAAVAAQTGILPFRESGPGRYPSEFMQPVQPRRGVALQNAGAQPGPDEFGLTVPPSKGMQPRLGGNYPPETVDRLVKGAMQAGKPDLRMALFHAALTPLELARTLKSSLDIGWGGRNGMRLFPSHPGAWARMYRRQYTTFASQKAYDDLQAQTLALPIMARAQALKRPISFLEAGSHDVEKNAEDFMSPLIAKLPLGGLGLIGSERAYIAPGNAMRGEVLQEQVDTVEDLQGHEITDHDLQELVDQLNNATLRGNTNFLDREPFSAKMLGSVLFSLKGKVSGPQFLLDAARTYGDSQTSPEVKNIIRKQVRAYLAMGLSLLGAAATAGYVMDKNGQPQWMNVNMDRHSSGFGDIKLGALRWNFWGSDRAMLRLAFQLAEGKETKQGSPTKDASQVALAKNYAAGQLAPGLPKLAWDFFVNDAVSRSGDSYGYPIFSYKGGALYLADQLAPIGPQSTIGAYRERGPYVAAATAFAEAQGFSTSSYQTAKQQAKEQFDRAGVKGGLESGDIHKIVQLRDSNPDIAKAWGPDNTSSLAKAVRVRVTEELAKAGLPNKDDILANDKTRRAQIEAGLAEAGVSLEGITTMKALRAKYIELVAPQLVKRDNISYADARNEADDYFDQIPAIDDLTKQVAEGTKNFWLDNPQWLVTAYDAGLTSLSKAERALYDEERDRQQQPAGVR